MPLTALTEHQEQIIINQKSSCAVEMDKSKV